MPNISQFTELQNKRSLMAESYNELAHFFTLFPEVLKILQVVTLILMGWLISFLIVTLVCDYIPLTIRKPDRDIFFAVYKEKLRKTFHHQTEETFQTIVMGTNRILRKNYEEPTVFLMLVPQGAMPTARRLVFLLVHCILVSYQLPASKHHVQRVISDGCNYTSPDDEWPLFYEIKRKLRFYGVAAITSFECLHPQVVRTLKLLMPQMHAPSPESMLILVVDLKNRFTEHQKKNCSANHLGKTFLQEHFGPYFDRSELANSISCLACRCLLVNPEPGITNNI